MGLYTIVYNKEAIMARKKKEPVVEEVVETEDASATFVATNDKIPDVVYSKLNLINVASIKSILNAGLNTNTIVKCLDTNDMYVPTKAGTVSQTVKQLETDGILKKPATA